CLKPICLLLGSTERTMEYCIQYGIVTCIAIPCGMLKEMYLFLLRADNAPKLSMLLSILGGVTNVILDYVFVAVLDWGIAGAGWATVIGMLAGSLVGIVHFVSRRAKLRFHFVVPKLSFVWRISMNGMSNFTNNFAAAIITFLYNMVTIPLAGEAGVAAVTMILYAQFLFLSIFTGYMAGAAPTLGYNYGAGNVAQNKKLVRFLIVLVMITSVVMFALAELFGGKLIGLLVTEEQVNLLADRGMQIYSWGFLAAGVNIFVSGLFTAYGKGLQGGMIAFSRALFVLGAALLTLPHFFGVDGIWLAGAVAEFVTLFLSLLLFFLPKNRKKYEYI
ncbi:MAG: MATE family efflux transporter, partial [Lachnospiraceae bacterium]